MKRILGVVFVCVLLLAAGPAFAGKAVQMWACEIDDEADEEMVETYAKNWLAAAKKLDGGENLEGHIFFPVAVNATGEADAWAIVTAPSFAEWGRFWDAYPDSEAADIEEDAIEYFVCPDSVLWESVEVVVD